MMKTKFILLLILFFGALSISVKGAVWQWSVAVKTIKNDKPCRAYLWIPPDCKRVKAFIFAQNNMEEHSILEDPEFRKAMGKLGIAQVWISPAYDLFFNFNQGAGTIFSGVMNDLAEVSGYKELRDAPFIGMGHSAAASAPYYMAAWNPERALAAISVSGQWPYFRHPVFAPDIWGTRNIDFIPCLETMGEYEDAENVAIEGLKQKTAHPLMPLSMLASPAEGHFAGSTEKGKYIALYIKKVMQYRLPKGANQLGLRPIDPTNTGWLVYKWRKDEVPRAEAAPVGRYNGDPAQAFWYFDEELAKATLNYQARHRNKKVQLIGYVQNGKMVGQRNTHQQVNLKFEPLADGITFKLGAAFYDTIPGGSPRPAIWAEAPAGEHIGHVKNAGSITIQHITGPMIKLNDSTFRIQPQSGFWQNPHSYELWFAAIHPGDERYKPAVQQAQMLVPPLNTAGRVQQLTFSAIPDQRENEKGIKLNASSDANVPVSFYVQDGPAEIVGDRLNLLKVPPGSRFPVKVTVVAWQYGNSNEPKLQTANPVINTFWIRR
ncbi:hypothetical protein [Pedobacter ginsengisoli]|nr:hypothetical protein [Pedobacter ginsengisoli]